MATTDRADRVNLVDVLRDEASAVARLFGVQAADAAASMLVTRVVQRVGGGDLYVPGAARSRAQVRDADIRERHDGTNVAELAREYGITVRHVYRILGAARREVLAGRAAGGTK